MKRVTILLIIISLLIIGLGVVGIGNKSFFKDYYKTTNDAEEIVRVPLPLFSYFKHEIGEYDAIFKTLNRVNRVNEFINNYLDSLTSCYDESYFYDQDLGITIKGYSIKDGFPLNEITISYIKGNQCENQYVLEENWTTNLRENALIKEVVLTKATAVGDTITYDSKMVDNYDIEAIYEYIDNNAITRIENKDNIAIVEDDGSYVLAIYYDINDESYDMKIFSHDTGYLAVKIIDSNDHAKNAIYDMKMDVNLFLKQIFSH